MFGRLLLAAALTASLAMAQRGGGRGGGGGMGGDEEAIMRPQQRQSKFDLFAEKLKLNKEQKEGALAAVSAAFEEGAPVRQQVDKSRVAIATALIDGKGDDEVKKLMDEYTVAAAQRAAITAKAFSKVYAALKPNQQSKAPQTFDMLAGLLDPVVVGGGRGGRGRGRQ